MSLTLTPRQLLYVSEAELQFKCKLQRTLLPELIESVDEMREQTGSRDYSALFDYAIATANVRGERQIKAYKRVLGRLYADRKNRWPPTPPVSAYEPESE